MYQQLMSLFADVLPFLKENPELAPSTHRKLLAILNDTQKSFMLQLELAAVLDAGELFVKATIKLEGDGTLVYLLDMMCLHH